MSGSNASADPPGIGAGGANPAISLPRPYVLIMKGGGAKGLAFAGAIQVLEEHGFKFDTFVGASAGAITAVLMGAGYTGSALESEIQRRGFETLLDAGPRWLDPVKLLARGWIHRGDKLSEWIDGLVAARVPRLPGQAMVLLRQFSGLKNRVVVYAAGPNGGPVTFDSAGDHKDVPAALAARYSASIPGFFRAESFLTQNVYDGGSLNNFPVDIFLQNEPPGTSPDFLGLYLSDEPAARSRSFWMRWGLLRLVADVVATQLKQGEASVLTRYPDKVIAINPAPVKTTQFALTSQEKLFLLAEGRAAAFRFLSEFHPEKKVPAERLIRALNDAASAKEALRGNSFSTPSLVAILVAVALALAGLGFWFGQRHVETPVGPPRSTQRITRGDLVDPGLGQTLPHPITPPPAGISLPSASSLSRCIQRARDQQKKFVLLSVSMLGTITGVAAGPYSVDIRIFYSLLPLVELGGADTFTERYDLGRQAEILRWDGPQLQIDSTSNPNAGAFSIPLESPPFRVQTLVTGMRAVHRRPLGRHRAFGLNLPVGSDYMSYPNTDRDSICEFLMIVQSPDMALEPYENGAYERRTESGGTEVGVPHPPMLIQQQQEQQTSGDGPPPPRPATQQLSARWRDLSGGETVGIAFSLRPYRAR